MDFNTFFAIAWLIFGFFFLIQGALIKGYMDYLTEKDAAIMRCRRAEQENAELRARLAALEGQR